MQIFEKFSWRPLLVFTKATFGAAIVTLMLFTLPSTGSAYTLTGYKWSGASTCVNTSSVLWPSSYNGSVTSARSAWNSVVWTFLINDGSCGNYLYTGVYGQNGTVAFTNSTYSDSWIIDADITLNVSYPFSTTMDSTKFYIPTVLTHEIGHLLGLGHSSVTSAVMYYAVGVGDYRTVGGDDGAGKDAIY